MVSCHKQTPAIAGVWVNLIKLGLFAAQDVGRSLAGGFKGNGRDG